MSASAASFICSPPAFARPTRRSTPTSCESSSSKPPARDAETVLDALGVLHQEPVVVPCGVRDGQRQLRLHAQPSRPHRLLLRVAPPVPGALRRCLDQRAAVVFLTFGGWGGQGAA